MLYITLSNTPFRLSFLWYRRPSYDLVFDQNIPNANICTDLPTYTYPDPKDGDVPAFVVTQVFIFETIQ
jgi:hypothetical protein